MSNPAFIEGSLPRRKKPGEALTGHDSLLPVSSYGIHNTTPPALADGDVVQGQMDDMGNIKVALGDPAQVAAMAGGMWNPYHDEQVIDESSAPGVTTITYKLDGSAVAVKTITVVGTTTTIQIAPAV
jgi:hypothetical protein